ncbi:cupin domain-containing protein [Desulfohalobium retbaense]|uniref:Cupin 2 conserved barrel domain protein n=1 Tax=Desulfohalobium retbaense (strain ATCC 49708 / DSM 5692 / JCM 16813 / HR100) TaxID=485915 RepID=C8X5G7_DESRD|nr:cupin domain-containing protein [Desulfohalobium retbaense]ACV69664.1 Cupin 2 conserved barrel domain protein [Desulfohalobium retbaense DSM 5692]
MHHTHLYDNPMGEKAPKNVLVHDSPYFKIINFNLKAGQEVPVHSHDIEGQLSVTVIEGNGAFLGADNATLPARAGDVLVADISEPHGFRAETDMRVLVTIAPPI